MLNLRTLTADLIKSGLHRGDDETGADNSVIKAIGDRHRDLDERKASVVDWLNRYRVLRGIPGTAWPSIASQILSFADQRTDLSLPRAKDRIVAEFNKLKALIETAPPLNRDGGRRNVTSLTSKALSCCYPDDVPIFDRNAQSSLAFISRVCRIAPTRGQSDYASFVDVWLQVYAEVDSVIESADLSDCRYKVRVLDRILWYLGQPGFYSV